MKEELLKFKDEKYKIFQSSLVPSTTKEIIGIRVPVIRKIAKKYQDSIEKNIFLNELPHEYYDYDILHSIFISNINDYDLCIEYLNKFLPYIDNWAVCDIISPKIFKYNKEKLIINIKKWISSKHTYTIRFGICMLMKYYLDDDYKCIYLKLPNIKSNDYYVNMMIAWFYATSLINHYDDTIKYLEENKLDKWVHNKTIQKAIESYRINDENKKYLKSLKR